MTLNPVKILHDPGLPLVVMRRQVRPNALSRVVPECCGAVWQVLRSQGLRGGRNVAIYWDSTIRLEVGVEFQGSFIEQAGVVASHTPGGLVASLTHYGPYSTLGVAHEAVLAWCQVNRYRTPGPRWEVYGHWLPEWDTAPSSIQTDVFYQVVAL